MLFWFDVKKGLLKCFLVFFWLGVKKRCGVFNLFFIFILVFSWVEVLLLLRLILILIFCLSCFGNNMLFDINW